MKFRQKKHSSVSQAGAENAPNHTTVRGSKIVVLAMLIILVFSSVLGLSTVKIATAKAAAADALEYTVDPTNAAGGVYARYGPHTDDTNRVDGYGVYPNEVVELLCGVTDGDPVGQYNNTTWHFVTDLSNTGEGNFWVNDHYLDTPNAASQLTPGESLCPNESSDPVAAAPAATPPPVAPPTATQPPATPTQPTVPTVPNPEYNRLAAVNWALAHAQDPQTNGEECAKFVSEALWAGELPQTLQWNNQGWYRSGLTWFDGTVTANAAQPLLTYLEQNYSTEWVPLGKMSAGNNNVPEAEIGDIIAYSWNGDGTIDHLAFIVGFAEGNPEYPLVAEWGQFANYGPGDILNNPTSPYVERGWTWSEINHMYLQQEPGNQGMTAYLLHFYGGYEAPNY